MKLLRTTGILAIAIAGSTSAIAQQKPPTEAQCRQMVDGMLQMMKSSQSTPNVKESDKQGAKAVTDRAEKVVKDNRARGASECASWAAITNIVTNQ